MTKNTLNKKASQDMTAWYVKLTSGNATSADRSAFQEWLSASTDHQLAYEHMVSRLGAFDDAMVEKSEANDLLGPNAKSGVPQRPAGNDNSAGSQKGLMPLLRVAATIVLLVGTGLGLWSLSTSQDYVEIATEVGEQFELKLADQSTIHLNTDTALRFTFSDHAREVILEKGEAFFEVSKDPARPFTVQVLDRKVRVIGTAFNIAVSQQGNASVTVTEGTTEVTGEQGLFAARSGDTATLTRGQSAVFQTDQVLELKNDVSLVDTGAWTSGQIVYISKTISEIIQDLDRYTPSRLIFRSAGEDPSETVSGVINLADEEEMLRRLEALVPISVRKSGKDAFVIEVTRTATDSEIQ